MHIQVFGKCVICSRVNHADLSERCLNLGMGGNEVEPSHRRYCVVSPGVDLVGTAGEQICGVACRVTGGAVKGLRCPAT